MSQFSVHHNVNPTTKNAVPYPLSVQSNLSSKRNEIIAALDLLITGI